MAFGLNLGNLQVHLLANTTLFARGLRRASTLLTKTSFSMRRIATGLGMYVAAPIALIGGASLKAFSNFDDAMTQSLAIMKDVGPEIREQMENVAKSIAAESITSPRELAKSYFYLASAGLNAEQSMAALATVEKFAVAGMFDMAQATDLLTDAQSALGLTVKNSSENMMNMTRVSDVLVRANTLANASVEQFSTALTSKAGTAMKSYNIQLEEGVAVLAAYADQGIKSQYAGNMFDRMIRLTIKSINGNEKVWKKMNIRYKDAQGNLAPLADIIQDITTATAGMGAIQKAATLDMLGFEARSQQAILPLLGLSNNIRAYKNSLEEAGGTTKDVADKQLKSFASQIKIVWNNVKLLSIEIGEVLAPYVITLGGYIKDAVKWFRNLGEASKTGIMKVIGSIRIGGVEVETWMIGIGSAIWQAWDYSVNKSILIWDTLWYSIEELGSKIYRGILYMAKSINGVFWWLVTMANKAFVKVFDKMATTLHAFGRISDEALAASKMAGKNMIADAEAREKKEAKFYQDLIDDSLSNSEDRWKDYYETVAKLDAQNAKNMAKWEKVRADAFKKDASEAAIENAIAAIERENEKSQKVRDAFEEANKVNWKKVKGKTNWNGDGADSTASAIAPAIASSANFQEMSLRRFSIAQTGSTKVKKQEVQDTTVAGKLDVLIQQGSKKTLAVLG